MLQFIKRKWRDSTNSKYPSPCISGKNTLNFIRKLVSNPTVANVGIQKPYIIVKLLRNFLITVELVCVRYINDCSVGRNIIKRRSAAVCLGVFRNNLKYQQVKLEDVDTICIGRCPDVHSTV